MLLAGESDILPNTIPLPTSRYAWFFRSYVQPWSGGDSGTEPPASAATPWKSGSVQPGLLALTDDTYLTVKISATRRHSRAAMCDESDLVALVLFTGCGGTDKEGAGGRSTCKRLAARRRGVDSRVPRSCRRRIKGGIGTGGIVERLV